MGHKTQPPPRMRAGTAAERVSGTVDELQTTEIAPETQVALEITVIPAGQRWQIRVLNRATPDFGDYPDRDSALSAARDFARQIGGRVTP